MHQQDEKPLWVFLHIPKTAGSSVRSVIEKNVPVDRLVRMYGPMQNVSLGQLVRNAEVKLRTADILYGHIEARVHQYVDRKCQYITVLRDPAERILSAYKYIRYDASWHPAHEMMNRLTIDEWLDETPKYATNNMSRILAGYRAREDVTDSELFAKATKTLQTMPVFGLQERFRESLTQICKTLNWPDRYAERNRSSLSNHEFLEKDGISDATLARIRKMNEVDRELHQFAGELFDIRLRKEKTRRFFLGFPKSLFKSEIS